MRRFYLAWILALALIIGLVPVGGAMAAETPNQINPNYTEVVLYDANGEKVPGTVLGQNDSVVLMRKAIEPYMENGAAVENKFTVTLDVQTSQNLKEIASDTPDSAVLLVVDVSNSMDDCVKCGKEQSDQDHEGTTIPHYYCQGTSGTEYASGRNGRCIHCGQRQSNHEYTPEVVSGKCAYQSRLDATVIAAKDFLAEFATETGAQSGDKRLVGIVAYGTHAVTALNWTDVTSTTGMNAAVAALDGLTIANGNYSSYSTGSGRINLNGGGTSIESGLALARNLLSLDDSTTDPLYGVDYRYTILLTDGQPTYPASNSGSSTSTRYVQGSTGTSGSSTEQEDMNNVASIASTIKSTGANGGKSKLYSICFGKVTQNGLPVPVWNQHPFGNWSSSGVSSTTTIGAWLESFSTDAFNAEEASSAQLFDQFESIISQIQVAAKAWKVDDWMGPYMHYEGSVSKTDGNSISTSPNAADYPNGVPAFRWDLLTSNTNDSLTNWDDATGTGTLGYRYQYVVTLDNQDTRYSTNNDDESKPKYNGSDTTRNPYTDANTRATLRYATTDDQGNWPTSENDYHTGEFPVPQVQGLLSSLTFKKVDQDGNPLEGWEFRLRSHEHIVNPGEAYQWKYIDATSQADGTVTFTGIPSGHVYTLLEAEKNNDYYLDIGDISITVSWGEARPTTDADAQKLELKDGAYTVVNTYNPDMLGKLTLKKRFAQGSETPASILFVITNPEGETVDRVLYPTDANAEGDWEWTMTGLPFGEYKVEEKDAIDAQSIHLRDTHDLTYTISVDGAVAKTDTYVEDDPTTYPFVTFELKEDDPDKTVEVLFNNNMTKMQGSLSISKQFIDVPADLLPTGDEMVMNVTATPVTAEGAELPGPVTFPVKWDDATSSYVGSMQLPIGYYKLTESLTGTIPGYSLLHYAFATGTEEEPVFIEDSIVEIKGHETLAVNLRNHYAQDTGRIRINKLFKNGDATATEEWISQNFGNHTFVVNVYDRLPSEQGAVIVDTLYLDEGDGQWSAESMPLPLGETYYLQEVTAEGAEGTAYLDGYVHTVTWDASYAVDSDSTFAAIQLNTKDQTINLHLTNAYEQQLGFFVFTKTFHDDLTAEDYLALTEEPIKIHIHGSNGIDDTIVQTVNLPDLTYPDQPVWTVTSQPLPHGTYWITEESPDITGYTHQVAWALEGGSAAFVDFTQADLEDGHDTHYVELQNHYTEQVGQIQVTKNFPVGPDNHLTKSYFEDNNITIKAHIYKEGYQQGDAPLDTLELYKDHWMDVSAELPVGNYVLVEEGADVYGYGRTTTIEVDGQTVTSITVAEGTITETTLNNIYTLHKGALTVTKDVAGDLDESPFSPNYSVFPIELYRGTTVSGEPYSVGAMPSGYGWTVDFPDLPLGTYTLREAINNDRAIQQGIDLTKYQLVKTWEVDGETYTGDTVTVEVKQHGQQISISLTNTFTEKETSVRIPVQKIVHQTGNADLGTNRFEFVLGILEPLSLPEDVRIDFVNDPLNAHGSMTPDQTLGSLYAIEVNGANTVKGWIEVSGKPSDLKSLKLGTIETLYPFDDLMDVKANGWVYDETAANWSGVVAPEWIIEITLDASGNPVPVITKGADVYPAVAFDNTYEKSDASKVPLTGDSFRPGMMLLLCLASLGSAIILFSRKRKPE